MELSVRKPPALVPSFSLTSDILSFERCGLQYRYHAVGGLPASRPVQMWFGQFLHGVLEEAFRRYRETGYIPGADELDEIRELVGGRLEAQNLYPRSHDVQRLGHARAATAVDHLGPDLFPLIDRAEVRLTSTRRLPDLGEDLPARYQVAGIIDVITHVQLDDPALQGNRILQAVRDVLPPALHGEYEVIVDYKGMRRASTITDSVYEWQLRTYAHLRSRQPDARPVVAGILLFLNELHPTITDLRDLAHEVQAGTADLPPEDPDDRRLLSQRRLHVDDPATALTLDYRRDRSLHVIPIQEGRQREALREFDDYAARIERARARERATGDIQGSWPAKPDDATCAACDFRATCPEHPDVGPPRSPRGD